ncbi:9571_t:CDS:2 [Ambispora gerdemannii]|uniref:9571_t:CDS:1 n=1 Tax=Ambispora gerdemannii TaxID=144530 RepID=A0A9N9H8Y5_9GLOM|nr:9571_t:CDS:2 [Ambispora gerdemannii]
MSFSRNHSYEERVSIPEERVGTVIGRSGSNIKKIRQETGAHVFIKDGVALIKGTTSQRAQAKTLIQEIMSKESHQLYPDIGCVLLEIDNEAMDIKQSKIRFREYRGQDANIHSRNRITYYLEHIIAKKKYEKEKGKSSENTDGNVDLTSAIAKLSVSNVFPSGSQVFNTTDIIRHFLGEISNFVRKSDPSQIETKSVRINIFFGRQLFSNIVDKEISINEWCAMDRSRTSTSFQHNAPRILEKIDLINEKYGFSSIEKETNNSKKLSVWKITKCARGQRRKAILDVISGSDAPDFRFLLKTGHEHPISMKHTKVITDLQRQGLQLRDERWFRERDFNGKINVESIIQGVTKQRYVNDKFQISFISVLKEAKQEIFKEDTIKLKHLSWKAFAWTVGSDILYDKAKISASIQETVTFAREIVKHVFV